MTDVDLNIISFDVPYPPNYGGVIDVFYKIKTLHELGVNIHLHCFDYGRGKQEELEQYCVKTSYYSRVRNPFYLCSSLPYVVVSRKSKALLAGLKSNNAPILFEGLHTCYFLDHKDLEGRIKLVRMHNIEHDYYNGLAKVEKNKLKQRYFELEAKKLTHFEAVLRKANHVLSISHADQAYLKQQYDHAQHLPVFHSSQKVSGLVGGGKFAFYHGNLAVGENNQAALFLVNEVFNNLDMELVIAGSCASVDLKESCNKLTNVSLKENLDASEIESLVARAHVNVLPTFQSTGIKLKLVLSLFKGRFCMANNAMVVDTGLESLCTVVNSADEWKQSLRNIFKNTFTEEIVTQRKKVMSFLDNGKNAQLVKNLLD